MMMMMMLTMYVRSMDRGRLSPQENGANGVFVIASLVAHARKLTNAREAWTPGRDPMLEQCGLEWAVLALDRQEEHDWTLLEHLRGIFTCMLQCCFEVSWQLVLIHLVQDLEPGLHDNG